MNTSSELENLATRAVEAGKGRGHTPSVASLLAELCSTVASMSVRLAALEAGITFEDDNAAEKKELSELESVTVDRPSVTNGRERSDISTDAERGTSLGELTTVDTGDDPIALMRISEEVESIIDAREESVNKRFESLRRGTEADKKKIRALFNRV